MSGVNEIRSTFLDYFQKNGHQVVASSSLVPLNDPTLMFTNAGMVQFKNVFTGLETRDYKRAVTSQKCVRAGGKHNDLDNVGHTARHHTFFEMLGNFSFGDYFKDQAIELAWNLITKEFGLPKDKLLVTVYSEDEDAATLWRKIAGISDDKIIRISTSDNFWSMGETGPCGPCSEIFYDHGDKIPGGPPGSPDEDGDRFIEIWNLVFMQYEQMAPGERVDLPSPSIDTGMGLERLSALLQGSHDNYDTDLFKALIEASANATGVDAWGEQNISHRVVADHLRSTSFLIADGVLPSNEGRGYVLRRIMRRAMRHATQLGARDPLMYRLVPELVQQMGQAFPELIRAQALITDTLELEEQRFRKTLDRGLVILDEATSGMTRGATLDGETAFKLYDTYGFPLDLTQDALRPRGIAIDTDGFDVAMERQKAEARANWSGSGDAATERVWFELREELGVTEFLGYDTEKAEAIALALVNDGLRVGNLVAGDKAIIVCNQTPFYAESGGQVGDKGVLLFETGKFQVSDTLKKAGGLFLHIGEVVEGDIITGAACEQIVDHTVRRAIRANHSATHLLHEALRQTLGSHVAQKGSMVSADRLRFDFSHPKPVSPDELVAICNKANDIVLQNSTVQTRLMAVDDAIEAGAMALFGEKYGDEVRVVSMGIETPGAIPEQTYSLELCGGTHVSRTGDIGLVTLLQESAVAAGVRRIEALTGRAALSHLSLQEARLKLVASTLKTIPGDVAERVAILVEDRKRLDRELATAKKSIAMGAGSKQDENKPEIIGGKSFSGRIVTGVAARDLKGLVDEQKKTLGSGVVCLMSVAEDDKVAIVVGVTDDLVDRISAVDLVRMASGIVGGKGGGGRADMAQAGGPDGSKAKDALDEIRKALKI